MAPAGDRGDGAFKQTVEVIVSLFPIWKLDPSAASETSFDRTSELLPDKVSITSRPCLNGEVSACASVLSVHPCSPLLLSLSTTCSASSLSWIPSLHLPWWVFLWAFRPGSGGLASCSRPPDLPSPAEPASPSLCLPALHVILILLSSSPVSSQT